LLIPDIYFNKIFFLYKNRYYPNFKEPESFNEKINYIKLYSKNPLRKVIADRLSVREFVKDHAQECKLIKILWYGNTFSKNTYDSLPNKFVIKANHGSGMVLIVDKNNMDFEEVYEISHGWQKINYGAITRQPLYNDLDKILIVEEFLDFGFESVPDYKFMCINGRVEFIQVDFDRFIHHKRNIYNRDFERINVRYEFPVGDDMKKPKLLNKAIEIAEKLSKDFDLLRVDLYLSDDAIFFGELTNTPDNGYGRFYPKEFDFALGRKMHFEKEFKHD